MITLTIAFIIGIVALSIKLISIAFKATWGVLGIVFGVILAPLALIVLACSGLIYIAFPLLIICGLITFFIRKC